MFESIVLTVLPGLFLIVLFGGGALLQRKNVEQGGDAPIDLTLFRTSKYLIIVLWGATVAQAWGARLAVVPVPAALQWLAVCLWICGFVLLFIGRLGLGDSFRLGSPQESTRLKVNGLFRLSRNPMYVGVYTTLVAAVLATLNPLVTLTAVFVIAVHHRIVLAEEGYLRQAFGQEYADYCRAVRRYL
jgi:protein-S-isoprenylcysteine O-methyltransferase Ste14